MLTFILIVLFIIYIISSIKKYITPDTRNYQQDRNYMSQLPDFVLHGKKLSSFWYNNAIVRFQYYKDNQAVFIQDNSGHSISGRLADATVRFDKLPTGLITMCFHNGRYKQTFNLHPESFSNKDWDILLNTICLAGTTYQRDLVSTKAAILSGASAVFKIIKALS